MKKLLLATIVTLSVSGSIAQTELYPNHFDLEEVTLLDSPFKTAMDVNNQMLF